MQKLFFSLFICVTFSVSTWSFQDSTVVKYDNTPISIQKITQEDLQTYKEDAKYNYTLEKSEITWWEDFKNWLYSYWLRFFQWLLGAEKGAGFLTALLRVLPYVLLGILIFILIKFFLKANMQNIAFSKKNQSTVVLSEEEQIIKNEDIQQLIKNAIKDKNYRLAIRYYYLFILKTLSEEELIDWQLQKTNDDYEQELKTSPLAAPFHTITRLYDYVWYGGFTIDELKYKKAAAEFVKFQNTISKS
tara:strand:- start:13990 stop:14727 length:738 start_codon:yes stop_codon:yes gene_type:complete